MDIPLKDEDIACYFEALVLPHLDAAYNLARWLTRNDDGAQEIVQAAFVRAFNFFDDFRGVDARSWLLTIVRHTYFMSVRDSVRENVSMRIGELLHCDDQKAIECAADEACNTPKMVEADGDAAPDVNQALQRLPQAFREIIVLKEMENLSYKEIAVIAGIPIATAMSRLARSRKLLMEYLQQCSAGDSNGLF